MLLILGLVFAVLLYLVCLKPLRHWSNKQVKHVKPIFPFGNLFQNVLRRKSISELSAEWYKQFARERYFGIYSFLTPVLVVKDLDLIKDIGVKEFDKFQDHQGFSNEAIDPLWSKNLFSSKGEDWRKLRPTLSPSFTSSKMRTMFCLIEECVDKFVTYFEEMNEDVITVEMKDSFTRYANDVIATCAFGVTCDSLREKKNEFFLKGIDATDFSGFKALKFFGYSLSPLIMQLLRVKIFSDNVGNFFRKLVRDSTTLRKEKGIYRPDMLQLMMEAKKKRLENNGEDITNEDMTAQALIFFFAGFDTTSTAMVFIAYELATNPDIQERLFHEVNETLDECNGKVTYEALVKMKYLDMIINETLRKWPPGPFINRECTADVTIEAKKEGERPLHLKKGDVVWFPTYPIQHDPEYYPEPEKFDPERFSDENKEGMHPATFLSFGIGPRLCIGSRFALMEIKSLIFQLVRKFEFVPVRKTPVPVVLDETQFTPLVKGGMWLGLKKRK